MAITLMEHAREMGARAKQGGGRWKKMQTAASPQENKKEREREPKKMLSSLYGPGMKRNTNEETYRLKR